jgi:ubiquitin carboxyl-terminal hydrolase 4/11/15
LGEEDAWYCPSCKKHQQATKKLDLWKLPDILVVHLKRFSHSRYHRDKIENSVNFPLTGFDLTKRVRGLSSDGKESVYDLYAISNHFG